MARSRQQLKDPPGPRRWPGALLAVAGAGGFTVSLIVLFDAMRQVLRATGGTCASGGPYLIAHPCPAGTAGRTIIGIFGMLVCGGVFAAGTSWAGGSGAAAALLMWSALFGLLGFAFLDTDHGSAVSGIVFEVMAAGGLAALIGIVRFWREDKSAQGPAGPEIVRAVVPSARS